MIRVLFVCLGNICRSPMAEAVFREMVRKERLSDKIEVDSGGTGGWYVGEKPHHGTREVLKRENIPYDGIVARQVQREDWDEFDYIIAMDDENIDSLHRIRKKENGPVIAKLMDFVENPLEPNVPDPYYTGKFDYTYQLISEGCRHLLQRIKEDHSLT